MTSNRAPFMLTYNFISGDEVIIFGNHGDGARDDEIQRQDEGLTTAFSIC